jgi:potassium-dependent mechanosensitive channel
VDPAFRLARRRGDFVALAAGYIRFASLVAERAVTAAIVLVALKLLLEFGRRAARRGTEGGFPAPPIFRRDARTPRKGARSFRRLVGGPVARAPCAGGDLSGDRHADRHHLQLVVVLDPSALSIELGETRIRLTDIVGAFLILLIGIVVTRILYRWLSRDILPRTELETSLQNSIATIAGYVGVIVAISLGLGRLGVNLENIALLPARCPSASASACRPSFQISYRDSSC